MIKIKTQELQYFESFPSTVAFCKKKKKKNIVDGPDGSVFCVIFMNNTFYFN